MNSHLKKLILAVGFALFSAYQVPVSPIIQPHMTFVDVDGLPCAGCKLYSYIAGTTTPQPTYTDSTGTSQNTNPITLGADGGANIWLGTTPYKLVLKNVLGSTVWTADNISTIGKGLNLVNCLPNVDCGASIAVGLAALGGTPGRVTVVPASGSTITTAITISHNRQVLFISPGSFTISAQISMTANDDALICDINGAAPDSGYGTCNFTQANGANLNPIVSITGIDDALFGVTIDGNHANNATGQNIKVAGIRAAIDYVNSTYSVTNAIQLGDTTMTNAPAATKISHSMFLDAGTNAMFAINAADVFISDTEFENASGYGILAYNSATFRIVNSDFGGNALGGIYACGIYFGFTSSAACGSLASVHPNVYSWMIANTQFGNNSGPDINVQGYDTAHSEYVALFWTLTGDTFIGPDVSAASNTYDAIHFQDSGGNSITGNSIWTGTATTYRYCIGLFESAVNREGADTVSNNGCANPGTQSWSPLLENPKFGVNDANGGPVVVTPFFLPNSQGWGAINHTGGADNLFVLGSTDIFYILGDSVANRIILQAIPGTGSMDCVGTGCTFPQTIIGGAGLQAATFVQGATYKTATNCAGVGTTASPSLVGCAAAASGAFSCSATASAGTCTIADTAVTANSIILVQPVLDEGVRLGVTCNTAPTSPPAIILATKTAGTGFTINLPTFTTNPACYDFSIVN